MIELSVRSYIRQIQSHQHDYHQLVLPLHGSIDIEIDGEKETIGPKRCAIIPAGNLHSFSADEKARFLVADMSELPSNMKDVSGYFVSIDDAMQAYILFVDHQLAQSCDVKIEQQINVLFHQLLLAQRFLLRIDDRIRKAINYLEEDLQRKINLATLADVACLSVSQYKVLFKQQMGKTTGQYLLALRMEKAKALLTYSDTPVTIVAEQVGYQDLSAFSRRFSSYFGQSPRSFMAR